MTLNPNRLPRGLAAILVLAVGPSWADAQRLAGTVLDATARMPIASVVVSVVDSAENALARTVTDGNGQFILPVAADAYRIELRRIGFRPASGAIPDSARTGNGRVVLTMEPVPQVLDPVRVIEAACPSNRTSAEAHALWEQAQAAFLASIVARDAAPARVRSITFDRDRNTTTDSILRVLPNLREYRSTRPFNVTRPPDRFAAEGYIVTEDGRLRFDGPDADVLLHQSFRATHCFTLAGDDPARGGQVGIQFVPGQGREGLSDIAGMLWMDRSPLALRSLDLRVVGNRLPIFGRDGATGSIIFETAANGVIFVSDWVLRFDERGLITGSPRGGGASVERVVAETGGSVVSAVWQDGTAFSRTFHSIAGIVVDDASRAPIANSQVTLEGTSYSVTTGPDGSFAIENLIPGPYYAVAADPSLAAFGVVPQGRSRFVIADPARPAERPAPTPITVRVLPRIVAARTLCGGRRVGDGDGVAIARILDAEGQLYRQPVTLRLSVAGSGPVASVRDSIHVPTGRAALCGISRGTLQFDVAGPGGTTGTASLSATGAATVDTVTIVMRGPPRSTPIDTVTRLTERMRATYHILETETPRHPWSRPYSRRAPPRPTNSGVSLAPVSRESLRIRRQR